MFCRLPYMLMPTTLGAMQLTEEDVREFQELWQVEFGETITADQARQRAFELLELYTLLARRIAASDTDDTVHSS
jgi:hypothetical protein